MEMPGLTTFFAVCALACFAPAPAFAQGVHVGVGGHGGVSIGAGKSGADVSVGNGSTGATGNTLKDTLNGTLDKLAPGDTSGASAIDQQGALQAVQSDRALPLDKIMRIARQYTDGDIIDARLVKVRGFLLYELKVLDNAGDVNNLYFYALSGRIVKSN